MVADGELGCGLPLGRVAHRKRRSGSGTTEPVRRVSLRGWEVLASIVPGSPSRVVRFGMIWERARSPRRPAERLVADVYAIGASALNAERVSDSVPL